jgi:DNA-binding SARP family transcriptional activator
MSVRLRVFGGLRMWRSGTEVAIGSARVRAVLAVLLAARGATVSLTELVDILWGHLPPATAVNQILGDEALTRAVAADFRLN